MNIARFGALRSRKLSALLLATATVAVVVGAITATGVPVSHVSANDGGVWLTNDQPGADFRGTFGEYNASIKQLGSNFGAPGKLSQSSYKLDVLQEGTTVLAIDQNEGELYPIDADTGSPFLSGGTTFNNRSLVAMDDGVAAILTPGTRAKLWATNVGTGSTPTLNGLNTVATKPLFTLPGGAALAVDSAGDVYAASRSDLITIPNGPHGFGPPRTTKFNQILGSSTYSLTTVGVTPVILDAGEHSVLFPLSGTITTLPSTGRDSADAVLQQSSQASLSVLVATATSLYSVPLNGQIPTTTARIKAPPGVPAAPVRLDGCAYGAWAGSPGHIARSCPGAAESQGSLREKGGSAIVLEQPVFRVNNNEIVLNDAIDGAGWTVAGTPVLNQEDWLRVLQGDESKPSNSSQNQTNASNEQLKGNPKLENPTLYARAGRDSTLHVLDEDKDPGGSILSIQNVTPPAGSGFSVSVSPDTQSVVVSLQTGLTRPVTFDYTVVDGFGLSATGPVTVDPTTGETPPTPPTIPAPIRHVVSGGTVSLQVLGDWRDRENDAPSIAQATVPLGDGQVSWTSDGLVTFDAPSVVSDTNVPITYVVSDGFKTVSAQIPFVVLGRSDTTAYPPSGSPAAVQIQVDQSTAFSPLTSDVFGADPSHPDAKLALAGPVSSTTGLTIATNTNNGVLTLTASRPGVYSLQYQATYGSAVSADTQILVQAVNPSSTVQPPVTIPTSVLLHGQYAATVDVLASDYDPSGGLLSVVGVTAPPGFDATILQGEFLQVAATSSEPPTSDAVVSYEVTNGRSNPVSGQVDVAWEPPIAPIPPVVPSTFATVRAGDEVNVPVLVSASDPDGETVHLLTGAAPLPGNAPKVVQVSQTNAGPPYASGLGSASISGGFLRYAAPSGSKLKSSESITLSYLVESQNGQRTTGKTFVTVNPDDKTNNAPPQPQEVDARVTAGQTVTIPIPTSGVDPDGDSVTLTGLSGTPQLGRVLSFNADSVTYQSYPISPGSGSFIGGTDSFTYDVENPSGMTADATVRVGVSPPVQSQPPVAEDHYVTAAPNSMVVVDLLTGDIVAPNDQVKVEALDKTNAIVPNGATLEGPGGNLLQVKALPGAATLNVAYGISDGTAPVSTAHVVVRSQKGFVSPPIAIDYFPTAPSATAKSFAVNVLAGDSDPGGRAGDLSIVGSPVLGVTWSGSKLMMPVTPMPHSVPYIIQSKTTLATAVGVVYVPGVSAGPQLKPNQLIAVPENGSKTINIDNYITDSTQPVRVTTGNSAIGSPAGGLTAHVGGNTSITLHGGPGYVGPGSLSVQVIDASSLSAQGAHTVTFDIPVQVGKSTPVVRCPSSPLTVTQNGPPVVVAISSVCQVWTPDGSDPDTVKFSESWAQQPAGVNLGWEQGETGQVLSISAGAGAQGGGTGRISIGVPGGGVAAGSSLSVIVAATAQEPLPTVTPVNPPPVETGQSVKVDMAQYVSSPLKAPDIAVISLSPASSSSVTTAISGSVITLTPQSGTSGTRTFTVVVSDMGANDPARRVSDAITLQILDKPSPPTDLQGVPGDKQVTLTWDPSADNGAPVEYYYVSDGSAVPEEASGTSYTWTDLNNSQPYTFTVAAVNEVGEGMASDPATITPRSQPDAPSDVSAIGGNGTATVMWTKPDDNGSPITGYTVFISPASSSGTPSMSASASQTSIVWSSLNNNVGPYTFTVQADTNNGVGPSPISTSSDPVYAHDTPTKPPAPSASGAVSADQSTTTITVTWPAVAQCNDAQPCASYDVIELKGGSQADTETVPGSCSNGGSACTANFGPITNDGSSYTYELEAENQEQQTSLPSVQSSPPVIARGIPGQVTDLQANPGDTKIGLTFTLPASHSASIGSVEYTVTGGSSPVSGSWTSPGTSNESISETVSGLVNGTTYSVSVTSCNDASECGSSSNSVSADPYGQPNPPSVSAAADGNSITFGWLGGGNNGRPVSSYEYCIDTSCSTSPVASSTSVAYQCGSSPHTIYAYVVDSVGQKSMESTPASTMTAACPPPPPPAMPSISASEGSPGTAGVGTCQVASDGCNYLNFTVSNFPIGSYIWQCQDPTGVDYTSTARVIVSSSSQSFVNQDRCVFGPGITYAITLVGVPYNGGTINVTSNYVTH